MGSGWESQCGVVNGEPGVEWGCPCGERIKASLPSLGGLPLGREGVVSYGAGTGCPHGSDIWGDPSLLNPPLVRIRPGVAPLPLLPSGACFTSQSALPPRAVSRQSDPCPLKGCALYLGWGDLPLILPDGGAEISPHPVPWGNSDAGLSTESLPCPPSRRILKGSYPASLSWIGRDPHLGDPSQGLFAPPLL